MYLYEMNFIVSEEIERIQEETNLTPEQKKEIIKKLFDRLGVNTVIENMLYGIINAKGDIDQVKSEMERLKERKKGRESLIKFLKDEIKNFLEEQEIQKIETSIATLKLRKQVGVVVIDDEKLIPDEYMVEKIEKTPDKKAIKQALKDDITKEIPGAHIEGEGEYSLQIKQ